MSVSKYCGRVVLLHGKFFTKQYKEGGLVLLSPARYCGLSDGSDPSHPCYEPESWFNGEGEYTYHYDYNHSSGIVGPIFVGPGL